MTETNMEAEVTDTKAVVKPKAKKKKPASKAKAKAKGKTYSAVHVDEAPASFSRKLVRVKMNFDTMNPEAPPAFDKSTGSFSLTYDSILRRGTVVEVSAVQAEEWVRSKVPMGYKGWGFTEGMEPAEPVFLARAEYV